MKILKKLTYLFLLVLPLNLYIQLLLEDSSVLVRYGLAIIAGVVYMFILDLLDDRNNAN
jgi:hypothetical protein